MIHIQQIIISVLSFSFQISGAAILLLWCLKGHDQQIKQRCLDQHSSMLWFNMDDTTTLSKDDLQLNAKAVYQNVFAFSDLIIGYACAIFVSDTEISPWCIFLLVVIATVLILVVETFLSNFIASKKYPNDLRVNENDVKVKPGTIAIKEHSNLKSGEDTST